MKKLLLFLIVASCFAGCGKEKENTTTENISTKETTTSQSVAASNTEAQQSVTQGEWGADGINPKTGTIFNENGDTKFLKASDLNSKFSTNLKNMYIKINSPNKDNRVLWTSKYMENSISQKFVNFKNKISKDKNNKVLLKQFEDSLNTTVVMDLILETQSKKLTDQAIRLGFFSNGKIEKIDHMTVKIGDKEFPIEKPGIQEIPVKGIDTYFFNIVITKVSPDFLKALYKVKINEDIKFTIKVNGKETTYTYKNIMEKNSGIYPLLMKSYECSK